MTDGELVQAIENAVGSVIKDSEERMTERMMNRIAESEERMTERMTGQIAESEKRMTERMTDQIAESEERMTAKISSLDKKLGGIDVEMGTLGEAVGSLGEEMSFLSKEVNRTLSLLKNDIAPSLRKLAEDYAVFAKKDDRLDKMAEDVKEMKTSLATCVAAVTQVNQSSDGE